MKLLIPVMDDFPRRRRPISIRKLMPKRSLSQSSNRFNVSYPKGPQFREIYKHKLLRRLLKHPKPPSNSRTRCPRICRTLSVGPETPLAALKSMLRRPHHPPTFLLVHDRDGNPNRLLHDSATIQQCGLNSGDTILITSWSFFPLPLWNLNTNSYIVVYTSLYHTLSVLKEIINRRTGYRLETLNLRHNNTNLEGKEHATLMSLGISSTRHQWEQLTLFSKNVLPPTIHTSSPSQLLQTITPRLLHEPTGTITWPSVDPNATVEYFKTYILSISHRHYLKFGDAVLEDPRRLSDYGIGDDSTILLCNISPPPLW